MNALQHAQERLKRSNLRASEYQLPFIAATARRMQYCIDHIHNARHSPPPPCPASSPHLGQSHHTNPLMPAGPNTMDLAPPQTLTVGLPTRMGTTPPMEGTFNTPTPGTSSRAIASDFGEAKKMVSKKVAAPMEPFDLRKHDHRVSTFVHEISFSLMFLD